MKRTYFRLLLGALGGFTALLWGPVPALAQIAPPLGLAQQFAVLGHSGVTGSTGAGTVVDGDVGSSPTATISNFPPSSVLPPFVLHLANDLTVQQAHIDAITAYNFLAAQGPGTVLAAQLDAAVLTSGIYSFMGGAADLASGGTLTLNGPGIFVFQVDSTLTANTLSNVTGTADPCSVYWRVGSSATLNGDTFRGNVIADASVTVGSGSNLTGRTLAGTGPTGAVTMAGAGGNTIGGCSSAGSVLAVPTLGPGGMALLIALLAGAAVLVLGRRSFSSS
jgi:Ice-binding-like